MIQQALSGMITFMMAKFILNDLPHVLEQASSPIYSKEFLNFVADKVATASFLKLTGVNTSRVLESIRFSKPGFAKLLNMYYHIATERATPEEVNTAFRIASVENSRLAGRYRLYCQTRPTGKEFSSIVDTIEGITVDTKAADTQSDKVIVVDKFMAVTHGMIVDRWEGYDLSGETYPLPFDLTNEEAELYRKYLDVLSR